ncbi:MAG TPA: ABC transporter permease subunit [Chthoniobacteraceae bacterium]|jgi:microcin C transport system permease protein|nr:ABC transporter permease subunit [Chthoniobacteraceae bacterium]
MTAYIVRRLLLMIPTMLGITLACFLLCQFVPGGPVEQVIAKIRAVGSERGTKQVEISPEEVQNIKAYFGFDKPIYVRYFTWLGKMLHLDLGTSYVYHEPVWNVIISKMPISLFFGLTSFFLSYLISVPLGVWKAIKHHSLFDTATSVFVFTGYIIPSYALGILLIIFLAGGTYLTWFPLAGVTSDNYENLSTLGKLLDFLHHICLPMVCYMAGEFAFLTQLMKNSMLDELNKDYIRTALVKGVSFRKAIWKHGFRNALIPLATGSAELFTVMFAGSLFVERVFDIDGMGLLVYNSMIGRDYNVVLGVIVLTSILTMFGRLFADLLYVVFDPRIRLT